MSLSDAGYDFTILSYLAAAEKALLQSTHQILFLHRMSILFMLYYFEGATLTTDL